ncbi:polyprenyl synthetase family protein [Geothrix alkalitolerans]|uniref:polyprenyl synthetase family protein n=1 Tax=Geothrix alkalitolerans TaxID=2922724 RepID=UPI001FAF0D96|nr:polyprenyl synthetase family protein [Geothrix alkalitolerans]
MSRLDLSRYFLPIAPKLGGVEAELQRILQSDVEVVQKLADHVRGGQGKRLRPALVMLSSRFCGVPNDEDVRFGAVFELIHTATLVHDDVIDHAQLRRGMPTLNRLWGNTLTVLFGDLLYLVAMSEAIAGRSWRMMEIFAEVTTRMIEGELIQNDVLFKLDTSRKDYFDIQERKTALLFSGCTETGAVLTGRSQEECVAMRQYGLEVGRAFQLVDDLLDYTATSEQLGKPAFSDLREGKLTLPMLTLLEKAPDEARSLVRTIWDRGEEVPIPPDEEARLRDLITRHDALSETRELALKASRNAVVQVSAVKGDDATGALLREIPEALLSRSM